MAETEDTRLRKAGRWGLYGAGIGAAGYGLLAGHVLRNLGKPGLPIAGISALHGAIKGGAVGAGLGALTYRRPKNKIQELSSMMDDLINFQDPRPRNPLGEFQTQGEGGPDPNSMATVYKMPQPQQGGVSVGKAAGAALAGGALGAIGGQAGKAGWAQAAKIVKSLAAKRKSALAK